MKTDIPRSDLSRRALKHGFRGLRILALLAGTTVLAVGLITVAGKQGSSTRAFGEQVSTSTSQTKTSQDNLWSAQQETITSAASQDRLIGPLSYRSLRLDQSVLASILSRAPMEFTPEATNSNIEITLPMPDGTFGRFRIVESPISERSDTEPVPDFRSYSGQGIDDPTATARFDWSSIGFHAQIISASATVYVDPYAKSDIADYVTYDKKNFRKEGETAECVFQGSESARQSSQKWAPASEAPEAGPNGAMLRTLRTAIAATGEYTNFFRQAGDTDDQAKTRAYNQILTTMNRVNGIWERDIATRFVLLAQPTELSIIYPNPATDPYVNGANATTNSNNNQTSLDATLGTANYDIGHVFSVGNGGEGTGGVCQAGEQARGATATNNPQGDPFDVDFVAHEIIHQFNGDHTFNEGNSGSCSAANRGANGAYEPGSGSTVASYAGICDAADLQVNSDDYFHSSSIDQVLTWVTANACATQVATGNRPPTVSAGANFNIPRNTPFTLTATGNDPDGDAITFAWEEFDLGAASPPNTDNGNRPLFRPFRPTTSPSRTFPSLQYILNNANQPVQVIVVGQGTPAQHNGFSGENMPTTTRSMRFRVTARDNRAGGGGINTSEMMVNVDANAGPFAVTAPNTAVSFTGGTPQTATWNVASTQNAPVLAANIKISLSTDGGNTFPTVLLASTPNDGTEAVTIPNTPTTTARIKIEAVGNIFFDISDANFTITAGAATPTPTPTPTPTATATPTPTPPAQTTVDFLQPVFFANEGCVETLITVDRSGPLGVVTTVEYTVDNGTANQRGDFQLGRGTLVFNANETIKTFPVLINDDGYAEATETVSLVLQNPVNGSLGARNTATVQIQDNNPETLSNPIDNARPFVCQHYHDFLDRQSDQPGEDFWTNQIASCGTNAACLDAKRVNVSASFFQSIEFQQTGYFVVRAQKAGFGNTKGNPRYVVFLSEQRQIGLGVIVGQGNWQQTLDTNKQNYLLDFVTRPAFVAQFPLGSTAATYVDKLFQNTGATPATAERDAAIAAYGGGDTAGRAAGLKSVLDSGSAFNKLYNDAYVLMQYFGYLRRNPDDAPDNNFNGYDFWLAKMNSFTQPGEDARNDQVATSRVQRAEMVKAFIVSSEYRVRFFGSPTGNQKPAESDSTLARLQRNVYSTAQTLVWFLVTSSPV